MQPTQNGCMIEMDVAKAIQIRDVPDDVHATLRVRAAQAGLSLSDFLREELTGIARRPTVSDVLARAAAREGGAPRAEIVRAVRESRDAAAGE
jgi:plasmid stability protein